MTRLSLLVAAGIVSACASAAQANSTVTLQDREQAACYGDVQALCGEFMPDVEKTTACMATKRDKVSAGCAKYFNNEPAG